MSAPPLAIVFGEPVFAAPQDLFIPPDALRVFLERFEGPLDLLLYLIRRQNVNILDIPMVSITQQYLRYIDDVRHVEWAADYLLMAAVLLEIKSRMLLPRPRLEEDAEEAQDPRADLVQKLLAYEQMRLAAQTLDALPQASRDFFWLDVDCPDLPLPDLPKLSAADLKNAWQAILRRSQQRQHHEVAPQHLSVREQMARILRLLRAGVWLPFEDLFAPFASVSWVVVTLLAVLELARESCVHIQQDAPFSPIWVRLSEQHEPASAY